MYSDFEEKYGLISHAIEVLEKGLSVVDSQENKFDIFNLLLAKSTQFFGIMKTRELFEKAFTVFKGSQLIQVGLRFAKLERKLGEIDRCRSIYEHLS